MNLRERHAIISGGGRGIGRAIAVALKAQGARVSILGRNGDVLKAACDDGAADAFTICDVGDEAAVAAAVARLAEAAPGDLAVAHAGAVETAPFLKTDAARFRRMTEVNLIGTVNLFHATLPGMVARGHGRLVAVASTAGHRGYPYVSAYVAAKHAVIGLVRALAQEVARSGVTVNAVCPGYTDTDLVAGSVAAITARTGKAAETAVAELVRGNPQGRLIAPAEVAASVVHLCDPATGALNGQSIIINGGEF